MSRGEGFETMDMSTSICDDPKLRKLARLHPELGASALLCYVATVTTSWRDGRRLTAEDAWPVIAPYDAAAVGALREVGLLDRSGRIPVRVWDEWYGVAQQRREAHRARWRRANAHRADTARTPRGDRAETAAIRSSPILPEGTTKRRSTRDPEPVSNLLGPWSAKVREMARKKGVDVPDPEAT